MVIHQSRHAALRNNGVIEVSNIFYEGVHHEPMNGFGRDSVGRMSACPLTAAEWQTFPTRCLGPKPDLGAPLFPQTKRPRVQDLRRDSFRSGREREMKGGALR